MKSERETLRSIGSWLEDGRTRLPDHVLDAVLELLPSTPQRRPKWSAGRIVHLSGPANYAIRAAAVVAFAIVGLSLLGSDFDRPGGVGGQPSQSPTPSPRPLPEDGVLELGTYVARPLSATDGDPTVTYTVPAGWRVMGDAGLVPDGEPTTYAPGGMAIQFLDITTLNDPCRWSGPTDDVSVGPAVHDLVKAVRLQTAYEVSEPVSVTLGGFSGERVDIVFPERLFSGATATAPDCDNDVVRPWNTSVHGEGGVYAQGPLNRWQANVLDVDGTRLVVVVQDFPGTSPADRAELEGIAGSLVIEP